MTEIRFYLIPCFLSFQIIIVMLGISQYICGCFSVPFEPIREQDNIVFLMDESSILGELILLRST